MLRRPEVTRLPKFFMHPGITYPALVASRNFRRSLARQRLKNRFGGEHARFHGGMVALDLGAVEESGLASRQHSPGKCQLRQRLQAALVDRPCSPGNPLAVLNHGADARMVLPALKFLKRIQVRVAVVQGHDKAQVNQSVMRVIQKPAAFGSLPQRPA